MAVKAALIAIAFCLCTGTLAAHAEPVQVLVWDKYFDAAAQTWAAEPNMGRFGEVFAWDPNYTSKFSGKNKPDTHGLEVAYILMKDIPDVVVHRAHDDFLPFQDPELCVLTKDDDFNTALITAKYPPLPRCRAEADQRITEFGKFLEQHKIQLVNISHGTFYPNYVDRNPLLIHLRYPDLEMEVIYKFLYRNFLAIGEVTTPLFRDHPSITFVVAAGNNASEVDQDFIPQWHEPTDKRYPVSTYYGSYSSQFDNVISVAASYDGVDLSSSSNYSARSVDFAKHVGEFVVPDAGGKTIKFNGTSAAAAETSRLFIRALINYGQVKGLTPARLKQLARAYVTPLPALEGKMVAPGILEDDVFMRELAKLKSVSVQAPAGNSVTPINAHVQPRKGKFTEYHLPEDVNPGRYGCHSLGIDSKGIAWMTMPWANLILSLNPATGEFKRFPLPTPKSNPDGIAIDKQDRVWFGVDPKGGLGMIDPTTGEVHEYPSPGNRTFNIIAADADGKIWATSHQARSVHQFDPMTGKFQELDVATDWPLDIRSEANGSIWVAGMNGYGGGRGPGALIAVNGAENSLKYYPLPSVGQIQPWAYFVAPVARTVVVTSSGLGLFLFDKQSESFKLIQRDDGQQFYFMARAYDQERVMIANAAEKLKSIDILDPSHPETVDSYALPTQKGDPREAITTDSGGHIWYCQSFSDVIGRLELE